MSMTRADILYGCIGDELDKHVEDEKELSKIYEMLGEMMDIANGDKSNTRESDKI